MNEHPSPSTVYLDTQALIYAFEKEHLDWLEFVTARLRAGHRLVLSEETLYEFAGTGTLEAAIELTERAVALDPIWIRSFADLEAEELILFAATAHSAEIMRPSTILVKEFRAASQLSEKHQLTPVEFVKYAFHPSTKSGLSAIAKDHAEALDYLSRAVADGRFTAEVSERATHAKVRALLARGSDRVPGLAGYELDAATRFCIKHQKWMMRECPAYATEYHLANYRTSNPRRKARNSDSMDLMLATAAFPYVSTFLTNDGFLHGGLTYVKKHSPQIKTELLRWPSDAA